VRGDFSVSFSVRSVTLWPDMNWLLLESGRSNAAFNMAMDEALLEAMPRLQKPVLRFYGWTERAASFGYFQKFSEIERATLLRPLVRRPTGGGLVPHDADWTYSLAFPTDHEWYSLNAVESYRRVHEWIQAAFARLKIPTELASGCRKSDPGQCFAGYEKFDLLWEGKKIAGAAQRRNKFGLLIQGSVQPPPLSIKREDWELAMRNVGEREWEIYKPTPELFERVEESARKKYSQRSYNEKR
jgi:lipoyl(octanoyl) transferase